MSERWQRELTKLRSVELPSDLWARVGRGPGVDRPPPRRDRLVAAIVAAAVSVAAGGFAWQALRETGAPPVGVGPAHPRPARLSVLGSDTGPTATLSFEGSSLPGERGTYCWNGESSGICADAAPFGPPTRSITLPTGGRIAIVGDGTTVEVTLSRLDAGGSTSSTGSGETRSLHPGEAFRLPSGRHASGAYALDVFGTWPQGDAAFRFGVRIAPTTTGQQVPSDVADVTCTPGGARTSTPVVAAQRNGVHIDVANEASATRFTVHADAWDRSSGIGRKLARAMSTTWLSIPPGGVTVACLDRHGRASAPARFEVVDPAGLWTPLGPTCSGATSAGRVRLLPEVPLADPAEARTALTPYLHGLRPADRIVIPGYPASAYKIPTYVVVRDGEVIARLWALRTLHLDGCDGSDVDVARTPEEALACPIADRVEIGPTGNALATPGGAAFITVNIPGIGRTDDVVQVTSDPNGETEWSGAWDVIRDGAVVAVFDFDSLHGTACAGSGIGDA